MYRIKLFFVCQFVTVILSSGCSDHSLDKMNRSKEVCSPDDDEILTYADVLNTFLATKMFPENTFDFYDADFVEEKLLMDQFNSQDNYLVQSFRIFSDANLMNNTYMNSYDFSCFTLDKPKVDSMMYLIIPSRLLYLEDSTQIVTYIAIKNCSTLQFGGSLMVFRYHESMDSSLSWELYHEENFNLSAFPIIEYIEVN